MDPAFNRLIPNPQVIFRKDFNDLTVLFNPESDRAFSLNETGIIIWEALQNQNSLTEIESEIRLKCQHVPDDIKSHVQEFVKKLLEQGMIGLKS